jgi:hypothetical protein
VRGAGVRSRESGVACVLVSRLCLDTLYCGSAATSRLEAGPPTAFQCSALERAPQARVAPSVRKKERRGIEPCRSDACWQGRRRWGKRLTHECKRPAHAGKTLVHECKSLAHAGKTLAHAGKMPALESHRTYTVRRFCPPSPSSLGVPMEVPQTISAVTLREGRFKGQVLKSC